MLGGRCCGATPPAAAAATTESSPLQAHAYAGEHVLTLEAWPWLERVRAVLDRLQCTDVQFFQVLGPLNLFFAQFLCSADSNVIQCSQAQQDDSELCAATAPEAREPHQQQQHDDTVAAHVIGAVGTGRPESHREQQVLGETTNTVITATPHVDGKHTEQSVGRFHSIGIQIISARAQSHQHSHHACRGQGRCGARQRHVDARQPSYAVLSLVTSTRRPLLVPEDSASLCLTLNALSLENSVSETHSHPPTLAEVKQVEANLASPVAHMHTTHIQPLTAAPSHLLTPNTEALSLAQWLRRVRYQGYALLSSGWSLQSVQEWTHQVANRVVHDTCFGVTESSTEEEQGCERGRDVGDGGGSDDVQVSFITITTASTTAAPTTLPPSADAPPLTPATPLALESWLTSTLRVTLPCDPHKTLNTMILFSPSQQRACAAVRHQLAGPYGRAIYCFENPLEAALYSLSVHNSPTCTDPTHTDCASLLVCVVALGRVHVYPPGVVDPEMRVPPRGADSILGQQQTARGLSRVFAVYETSRVMTCMQVHFRHHFIAGSAVTLVLAPAAAVGSLPPQHTQIEPTANEPNSVSTRAQRQPPPSPWLQAAPTTYTQYRIPSSLRTFFGEAIQRARTPEQSAQVKILIASVLRGSLSPHLFVNALSQCLQAAPPPNLEQNLTMHLARIERPL